MDSVVFDDPAEVGQFEVSREPILQIINEWPDSGVVAFLDAVEHIENEVDAKGVHDIDDRLEVGARSQGHQEVLEEGVQVWEVVLIDIFNLIEKLVDHSMLIGKSAVLSEEGRVGRKDKPQFSKEEALDNISGCQSGRRVMGRKYQDARVGKREEVDDVGVKTGTEVEDDEFCRELVDRVHQLPSRGIIPIGDLLD